MMNQEGKRGGAMAPACQPDEEAKAAGSMSEFYDRLATESMAGAVMWHTTRAEAEARGVRDADYMVNLMEAMPSLAGHVDRAEVLDIGGGWGRIAKTLAPRVRRYVLLEQGTVLFEEAQRHLAGIGNVEFVKGDSFSLAGVADASVDFAFACQVLQHLDHEIAIGYMGEMLRVLKPLGRAWFHVPPATYPGRFERTVLDWPANLRFWQPSELAEVVLRLGFSIIAMDCDRRDYISILLQKPQGVDMPVWLA